LSLIDDIAGTAQVGTGLNGAVIHKGKQKARKVRQNKLSSRFRQMLGEENQRELLDVLIRLEAEPSAHDRSLLERAGCDIRTVAGDVVTARLELGSIDQLTDLDVVSYVELASPLYPEGGGRQD
jgi:hypothetical protein